MKVDVKQGWMLLLKDHNRWPALNKTNPVCVQATQHQHGNVPGLAVGGGAAAAADLPPAGAHQGPAHPAVPRRRRLQGPRLDC